jgi:hypothetical protein
MSMQTDNFTFAKSNDPQSVDETTPFKSKTFSYVNDINSGVYNNTGPTLVQFDLSSIYNSSGFSDSADLFLTIPIVMTLAAASATDILAGPTGGFAMASLKSNYAHLIHQIEVVANGKSVQDMQPYISIYKHFKMLSQMTQNDLANQGTTLGFADVLDSSTSMVYKAGAGSLAGDAGSSLSNNRVFNGSTSANGSQMALGVQNVGCVNEALQRKSSRYIDVSSSATNNFVGNLVTELQLINEFRPYYKLQTISTGKQVMTWFDFAVVRVKDLCDIMDKMGLCKKMDVLLRLYINTGSITSAVGGTVTAGNYYYSGLSGSTFSNVCPMTINYTGGALPTGTTQLVGGVYVAKSPATTIATVSVPSYTSPMSACRAYYSICEIESNKAAMYLQQNLNKRLVYESVITNTYSNIGAGGTFSQLVQSSIRNPLGVLLVPTIASATAGYSQWGSCFDSFPATFCPCLSLTNLQLTLGGVNQMPGTGALNYTFENFIEQISLAEDGTNMTLGMSCGLINQKWWDSNRCYWINLSRGTPADKATARNLNVSFTNNSSVAIDLLVFTVYQDEIICNISNGSVMRV